MSERDAAHCAESAPLLEVEHAWFHYPLDDAPQPTSKGTGTNGNRRKRRHETASAADAVDTTPWALRDVSLSVQPGEFLALVGRNGSGKSTLARCLNGLLRPTRGIVRVGGSDARPTPVGLLAREVGYVFQNPDHQLFLPSVRREIAWGPTNLGLSEADVRDTTEMMLERFGLQEVADRHPALIGRGLRRMTALAAVAALRPQVLILDEPTGGLDQRLTTNLLSILQQERTHGGTGVGTALILITHDMALVAQHASRMLVLHDGALLADGSPNVLFDDTALLEQAGLLPPETVTLAQALRPTHPLPSGITTPDAFAAAWFTRQTDAGTDERGGA